MTITEANAVNAVLRNLIDRHRFEQDEAAQPSDLHPEPQHLVEAAVVLAEKANKILGAGLTGAQVAAALQNGGRS